MSRKTKQSVLRNKLDDMLTDIREDIESGKLNSGVFLPSETELAEQYNISKHSVRKGLDVLVGQGYVLKIPRIGNKVRRPGPQPECILRFGYYPSMVKQASLFELIQLFHSRHSHIRVELIPIPFKFDDLHLMKHYLDSGMIDVAMFNHQSFGELQETDETLRLLEPLEPVTDIYPFLLPAFENDGRLYAMPFVFSPVILAYNKDHFEENDLPEPDSSWTWDDLLRVAGEITEGNNRVGFYYHALSDNRWPIFLLQAGAAFHHENNGKLSFSDPAIRSGIQTSRDILFRQGLNSFLSQDDVEAEELFQQGKISMIMTTYFGLNFFHDVPFPFEIAPLPALKSAHTLNLVVGLAVSANSPMKEAAKLLVSELVSPDYQIIIRRRTLSIPALKKAAERSTDPEYPPVHYEPSRFSLYREIIRTFRLHSDMGLTGDVLKRMRGELKLYWAGVTDLETCCHNLDELLTGEPVG